MTPKPEVKKAKDCLELFGPSDLETRMNQTEYEIKQLKHQVSELKRKMSCQKVEKGEKKTKDLDMVERSAERRTIEKKPVKQTQIGQKSPNGCLII